MLQMTGMVVNLFTKEGVKTKKVKNMTLPTKYRYLGRLIYPMATFKTN